MRMTRSGVIVHKREKTALHKTAGRPYLNNTLECKPDGINGKIEFQWEGGRNHFGEDLLLSAPAILQEEHINRRQA